MKSAEEILKPYVEKPFRHTQIVEKDNALLAMQKFADQFMGNGLACECGNKTFSHRHTNWIECTVCHKIKVVL